MYIHRRGPLDVSRPFSRETGPIVARDRCNLNHRPKIFSWQFFLHFSSSSSSSPPIRLGIIIAKRARSHLLANEYPPRPSTFFFAPVGFKSGWENVLIRVTRNRGCMFSSRENGTSVLIIVARLMRSQYFLPLICGYYCTARSVDNPLSQCVRTELYIRDVETLSPCLPISPLPFASPLT